MYVVAIISNHNKHINTWSRLSTVLLVCKTRNLVPIKLNRSKFLSIAGNAPTRSIIVDLIGFRLEKSCRHQLELTCCTSGTRNRGVPVLVQITVQGGVVSTRSYSTLFYNGTAFGASPGSGLLFQGHSWRATFRPRPSQLVFWKKYHNSSIPFWFSWSASLYCGCWLQSSFSFFTFNILL